ncbi:MAG: mechanosensitive ion channel family protein [bacterium]
MNILSQHLEKIPWEKIAGTGIKILITLALVLAARLVLKRILAHVEMRLLRRGVAAGEPPSESGKRVQTLVRLIREAMLVCLWGVAGMVILDQAGVKIGPILAGAGIVGVAIGFGAQSMVKDVISGFFLILENEVRVGDVAVINGTSGLVEKMDFRSVMLRDQSGVVHIFPNGAITTLSNLTYGWSAYVFDISVAYKENTDSVIAVLREIGEGMRKDEAIGLLMLEDAEIFGVDKLTDSAVIIKGRIKTKPGRQWTVGREFLRRVKLAFDEKGIEIPFPHQTLYFGEASKPLDLRLLEGDLPKK